MKKTLFCLLAMTFVIPTLRSDFAPQARASSASVRRDLIGRWLEMNPNSPGDTKPNGDLYTFRSNGTYTFTAGSVKRRSGNVSHSGTWRVTDGGETLRLHATRRIVLEGQRRKMLKANVNFVLSLFAPNPSGTCTIEGQEFGDLKFD